MEQQALEKLLKDASASELKQMLRTLYDAYLEASPGGISMDMTYRYRLLEKFLEEIESKEPVDQ